MTTKSKEHLKKFLVPYIAPSWASHLSYVPKYRVPLANIPTPIKEWNIDFCKDRKLWIKRDDLTGVLETGNKIRKLEFLLAEAILKGCDCVITIGRLQSNHSRATAVAARSIGLDSYLIASQSEPLDKPIGFDGNLIIDRFMNANIRLVSVEEYEKYGEEKLLKILEAQLIKEGKKPYVIPLGGSNEIGTWAYIEAINEIQQQMKKNNLQFDDIVFACGSGGTASGLAIGAHLSKLGTKVHGIVTVESDSKFFYNHVNQILQKLNIKLKAEDIIDLTDDYKGIGYAKNTKEELELFRDVAFSSGIVVDYAYTGKALNGMLNDKKFKGKKILFIHTGGMFSWYSQIPNIEKFKTFSEEQVKLLKFDK